MMEIVKETDLSLLITHKAAAGGLKVQHPFCPDRLCERHCLFIVLLLQICLRILVEIEP